MRRRALLAASGASGGGAPEFPLYLYFDYCNPLWGMTSCVREADEIAVRYFEYLCDMLIAHGIVIDDDNFKLYESNLNSLGIEIYIDDKKVKSMSIDFRYIPLHIEFLTDKYGVWHNDGSITMDY